MEANDFRESELNRPLLPPQDGRRSALMPEDNLPKKVRKVKDWSMLSSQIKTTEYNEQEKYLFIVYANGSKYRYAEVPLDVWEKSLNAASIGKFINTDIKPNFEFKKLN